MFKVIMILFIYFPSINPIHLCPYIFRMILKSLAVIGRDRLSFYDIRIFPTLKKAWHGKIDTHTYSIHYVEKIKSNYKIKLELSNI